MIDTLGKRLAEILIPVPKDKKFAAKVARETQEIIEGGARMRNRAKALGLELQGSTSLSPESLAALSER